MRESYGFREAVRERVRLVVRPRLDRQQDGLEMGRWPYTDTCTSSAVKRHRWSDQTSATYCVVRV